MKRIAYFLTMVLALPLFVACSNDTEEKLLLPQETPSAVKGTETREVDERPYYWAVNEKIYFKYLDNRAFIYFHPSSKEIVYQKLAERGIKLAREDDSSLLGYQNQDYIDTYFTNKGVDFEFLKECVWNEVLAEYKDVIDIPEILDACPNLIFEDGTEPSGTSIIYIHSLEPDVLQQVAEDYNVHIFGTDNYIKVSYVVCDKNSKGKALDIARDLVEKGIADAQPAMAGTASLD